MNNETRCARAGLIPSEENDQCKEWIKGNLSPGALRAGNRIYRILKKHFPQLSGSNAETLATIIDAETNLSELLNAARDYATAWDKTNESLRQRLLAAIAKAEGRQ